MSADVSAMTTGSCSLIAAEAGHQLVRPLGEVRRPAEGRDRIVLPHGVGAERVRDRILLAVWPQDGQRAAVPGHGERLAGLYPGENLRRVLVELPGRRLHAAIVLYVVQSSRGGATWS